MYFLWRITIIFYGISLNHVNPILSDACTIILTSVALYILVNGELLYCKGVKTQEMLQLFHLILYKMNQTKTVYMIEIQKNGKKKKKNSSYLVFPIHKRIDQTKNSPTFFCIVKVLKPKKCYNFFISYCTR